ncbi:MAG: hypothetical protein VKK98_05975 [Cyanobacteriota bacterium]|nr:hypothetical protein [Cyanobacteriota bacterium]
MADNRDATDPPLPAPVADSLDAPASFTRFSRARVWVLDADAALCNLLVLDQLLPDQTGTLVLRSLRSAGHHFPVLMLSALAALEHRIQGL